MKASKVLVITLLALSLSIPAIAGGKNSYPKGKGWQQVKRDFEEVDTALAALGADATELAEQIDLLQESMDAQVSLSNETSAAFAVDGNDGEVLVLARVEQMSMGVDALAPEDFDIATQQIVPAGCSAMVINEVSPLGPPGSYSLRLVPFTGEFWCAGTYIATLTVNTGAGEGGDLVKVEVPAAP